MTLPLSNVACVWVANRIFGTVMIDLLVEQPQNEWSKIICISRRPTQLDVEDNRVYFISIDILQASFCGVDKGGEYLTSRPYVEDAPRHKGSNFYYAQEDLLKEYAEKNGWKYIITRPNVIIGVSYGNFMNFAVSLALYACIQKEKGQSLFFLCNKIAWNSMMDHSNALKNARFQLWSSTNDKIQNEIFNIHNGDEVKFRTV
ncbi:unnamed protein product [Rotaria sp. Silwood2]|nr:unnamed protein product [Rotaria sp. Silwood2]CAF2480890.1 unnamed protein product [Rotaria sp. Silwood2]CAF2865338.1 unnamed protein product [Rotaria sp. Silwood2]CAF4111586.1 unnamed protein product [Rotaria sp. Silwood2]CAF4285092.1 unnamed protein product [Rotaria sp. Silwood2]